MKLFWGMQVEKICCLRIWLIGLAPNQFESLSMVSRHCAKLSKSKIASQKYVYTRVFFFDWNFRKWCFSRPSAVPSVWELGSTFGVVTFECANFVNRRLDIFKEPVKRFQKSIMPARNSHSSFLQSQKSAWSRLGWLDPKNHTRDRRRFCAKRPKILYWHWLWS